ncbi:MFS transporter [Pseudonocardia acaciae]|uniref:MFS transporter n=1 Tax=Pseudonocardia acaciae TaxID=551276 RepID=UPI000683E201|nr:MFS transporter [Pseudonocardia acaciae]
MSTMFRSFYGFNYRIWFVGGLMTNIGGWMQRTAQDWIVIAYLNHNNVTSVGIVIGLQFAPALILMPLTGYAADRIERRRLIIATQVSLAVLGAGLGLLTITGVVQLWHVYVFATLLGIVSAFDIPARQTFVSDLVGNDGISNAVALNSVSFSAGRLIGPAVGGVLMAVLGVGPVFLISAASFAAVVLSLLFIRKHELFPIQGRVRGPGQIREGFRYIRRRTDIIVLLVMVLLLGAFGLNFSVFVSAMARVEFDRGAAEFGLLSSMLAVGSFAGALVMARWCPPGLPLVSLAAGGFGVACMVSASMPSYWSFAASLVLVGLTAQTLMTSAASTVQLTTRPELRGRVVAVYMAIFVGGAPFGAPLVGFLGNELGPRWTLIAGGLSGLLAGAIAVGWLGARRAGTGASPPP